MNNYPKSTPWGQPDTVAEIAPGIVGYSTPSHGGIWLSTARRAQMPAEYRNTTFIHGGQWYEEDCDAAKVMVTFPSFFEPYQVESAKLSLEFEAVERKWRKANKR